MSCDHYQEQISALLDGELSRLSAWRLRRHLRDCTGCARLWAEWSTTRRALQRPPVGAATPPGFWDGIARRLDEVPSGIVPSGRLSPAPRYRRAAALLVFALAVLVWACFGLFALSPLPVKALVAPPGSAAVEEVSTDSPDAAARWLTERLGREDPAIDLSLVGRTLRSAALLRPPAGGRIGRLRYGEGARACDLLLLPRRRWDWTGWEQVTSGRYRFRTRTEANALLTSWQHGGLTFVLLTRPPSSDALRVAVQGARACSVE
jgi:anti-sigma factor RsiW